MNDNKLAARRRLADKIKKLPKAVQKPVLMEMARRAEGGYVLPPKSEISGLNSKRQSKPGRK